MVPIFYPWNLLVAAGLLQCQCHACSILFTTQCASTRIHSVDCQHALLQDCFARTSLKPVPASYHSQASVLHLLDCHVLAVHACWVEGELVDEAAAAGLLEALVALGLKETHDLNRGGDKQYRQKHAE